MPENVEVKATDLIRGEVKFNTNILDDKVIYKSVDSLPTYHLANVVDDYLMKITHVIRGKKKRARQIMRRASKDKGKMS